jgi:hypothetical protein
MLEVGRVKNLSSRSNSKVWARNCAVRFTLKNRRRQPAACQVRKGQFDFVGRAPYVCFTLNNRHSTIDGCADCHLYL